jgi:hypothetical protein
MNEEQSTDTQKPGPSENADKPAKAEQQVPSYTLPARYLDGNHWSIGNKSRTPATTEKLIYMAVGHALSNWEHVEAATAILFSHFIESSSIAAQRAYGSISGARGRQAALREASETYFLLRSNLLDRRLRPAIEQLKTAANQLIHSYGLASGRRNDVAHGYAMELSTKESTQRSWYLVAPSYQSKSMANWIADDVKLRTKTGMKLDEARARFAYNKIYYKNSDYVLGVPTIKTFAGKFAYLQADILDFLYTLNPRKRIATTAGLHKFAKAMS